MNSVTAGMNYFSPNGHGGSQIIPTGYLLDRKYVTIVQFEAFFRIGDQCVSQDDLLLLARNLLIVLPIVMSEIGRLGVGALLETSRSANQIRNLHVSGQRIPSGPCYLAFDVDGCNLHCGWIFVH